MPRIHSYGCAGKATIDINITHVSIQVDARTVTRAKKAATFRSPQHYSRSQSDAAGLKMAHNTERVAYTLNRLTDGAFVNALSARDQDLMSDFVSDFFCRDPETDIDDSSEEEEEPRKWHLKCHVNYNKQRPL